MMDWQDVRRFLMAGYPVEELRWIFPDLPENVIDEAVSSRTAEEEDRIAAHAELEYNTNLLVRMYLIKGDDVSMSQLSCDEFYESQQRVEGHWDRVCRRWRGKHQGAPALRLAGDMHQFFLFGAEGEARNFVREALALEGVKRFYTGIDMGSEPSRAALEVPYDPVPHELAMEDRLYRRWADKHGKYDHVPVTMRGIQRDLVHTGRIANIEDIKEVILFCNVCGGGLEERSPKMTQEEREVDLTMYQYPDFMGVIIVMPSGVFWRNQTCGTCCRHPSVEGIFIPIPRELPEPDPLRDYSEARLDLVQTWLERAYLDEVFTPTPKMQDAGGEAWIPVTVRTDLSTSKRYCDWVDALKPFVGMTGFITYPNSD